MSETGSTKLLVVEDDATNRNALVRLLQYTGALVEAAGTVASAREKLRASPHVVLLDVDLPDGSGLELLEQIRSSKASTKVAILSGSLEPEMQSTLDRLVPDALFMKPVDPAEIMRWVQTLNSPTSN